MFLNVAITRFARFVYEGVAIRQKWALASCPVKIGATWNHRAAHTDFHRTRRAQPQTLLNPKLRWCKIIGNASFTKQIKRVAHTMKQHSKDAKRMRVKAAKRERLTGDG
jgi:hypothetical protein